jgi:hypothetical protein
VAVFMTGVALLAQFYAAGSWKVVLFWAMVAVTALAVCWLANCCLPRSAQEQRGWSMYGQGIALGVCVLLAFGWAGGFVLVSFVAAVQ